MTIEWIYSLTGTSGKTLFQALRDKDFDSLISSYADCYEKGGVPGGDYRDVFIEESLWKQINRDDLTKCTPELQCMTNAEIKKWLIMHQCPIVDEELIREWAWDKANADAVDGILWDHVDKSDDVAVALEFGLVTYPPFDAAKQSYVDGDINCIPANIANEIYKHNADLEHKAVEDMIFVDGFYCKIHGGVSKYKKPVKKTEVIACPACGHPICPICANCYSSNPDTVEKSREYMESCDSNTGMAYCGNCGDYSQEFMLGFLKLIVAPIPKEYENPMQIPRENVEYWATATVRELPDFQDIFSQVKEQWEKGTTGIIKVQHPTGEIWGWTDRYPDKWVVTIMYPEER